MWEKVAQTIRPLSRDTPAPDAAAARAEAASSISVIARGPDAAVPLAAPRPAPRRAVAVRAAPRPDHSGNLDGHWDRRLRQGEVIPDRVLDLHGHSLDSAWQAIDDVLDRAIGAGDRLVLLITGHRRAGAPPVARGRIRAAVDDWLAASRHAGRIAAVRGAHRRHGGGGSLYVVLRRAR